jgi:hypothetical protein
MLIHALVDLIYLCKHAYAYFLFLSHRSPSKTPPARKHNPIEEILAQQPLREPTHKASPICYHRLPEKGQFLNLLPPERQSRQGKL